MLRYKINPGEFRHRIIIQKRNFNETTCNGFEDVSWNDFKIVKAKIKNINGKEYFQAQQAQSKASKKVTIRYIKDLDSSIDINISLNYRVKYNDQTYNILYSVNIEEQNKYLELLLESE